MACSNVYPMHVCTSAAAARWAATCAGRAPPHTRSAPLPACAFRAFRAPLNSLHAAVRAPQVIEALKEAIGSHGGLSAAGAADYVQRMHAEGRLMQELWS